MMLLRSQDRKTLINFDMMGDIYITNEGGLYQLCIEGSDSGFIIGEYKTEQRCIDELDRIACACEDNPIGIYSITKDMDKPKLGIDLDVTYPVTVAQDRYRGNYSGSKYTAWNLLPEQMPAEIWAAAEECMDFWAELSQYSIPVGHGDTPEDAIKDLKDELKVMTGSELDMWDQITADGSAGWYGIMSAFAG